MTVEIRGNLNFEPKKVRENGESQRTGRNLSTWIVGKNYELSRKGLSGKLPFKRLSNEKGKDIASEWHLRNL